MNRFAAKTRKEIDRDKYLRNGVVIRARCAAYAKIYRADREAYNAMRRANAARKRAAL